MAWATDVLGWVELVAEELRPEAVRLLVLRLLRLFALRLLVLRLLVLRPLVLRLLPLRLVVLRLLVLRLLVVRPLVLRLPVLRRVPVAVLRAVDAVFRAALRAPPEVSWALPLLAVWPVVLLFVVAIFLITPLP